jgi:hypothetical protein
MMHMLLMLMATFMCGTARSGTVLVRLLGLQGPQEQTAQQVQLALQVLPEPPEYKVKQDQQVRRVLQVRQVQPELQAQLEILEAQVLITHLAIL